MSTDGVPGLPFWRGLSMRLLLLTMAFVMLAEVAIFAPSVGRFRVVYLEQVLADSHLALMALEATPDGMVDMDLQRRLLSSAGTLGMTAWRPDRSRLMLGPDMPPTVDAHVDIREHLFFPLIWDALTALVRTEPRVIGVLGHSPRDPDVIVEAYLPEQPMIRAMRGYGWRILMLSLLISGISAALVFVALHLLLVRPLRRLTRAMVAFREDPDDPRRILEPSQRSDEVGIAEQALAEMQHRLRAGLHQQARLAAVGTAVSKISHDLKGILTTALLESDRLEAAAADGDLEHTTKGIARALERAVTLAGSTLRYATQGAPQPRLGVVALGPVLAEAEASVGGALEWRHAVSDLTVQADPELLLRVIENLGRNALQAGATMLSVTIEPVGGGVRVVLADNGPGLPARALEHLFQPFAGSARAGGSGLGLAIARELMQAQGGTLSLRRSDASGAVFVLDMALAPQST